MTTQAGAPAACPTDVRFRRAVTGLAVLALGIAACGKHGGAPPAVALANVYHLEGAREATSLELRRDGTFTLRRDSCESIGVLACGEWVTEPTRARVVAREGLYWPTSDAFPSAVVDGVVLHDRDGDLLVTVESAWAGRVTQRWTRGRACAECRGDGDTGRRVRACADPLPACAM